MNKVFAILVLFTVLQFVHSQDAKFVNCLKKITEQISSVRSDKKIPECVDKSALKQAQDGTKFFKDLYNEIHNECTSDMATCPLTIAKIFNEKQQVIKDTVKQIVTHLTQAFSGCFKDFEKNLSNINVYIANGCEDPKE